MRMSGTPAKTVEAPARFISLGAGAIVAYPQATTNAARQAMLGNRSRDTRPEVLLRSELHRRGLRFRKHLLIETSLRPIRPDIVFTSRRLAIFVDGCFWHGCPDHGTRPRSNVTYWRAKIERNRERDWAVCEALQHAGWEVLRVWEHEPINRAASVIEDRVRYGD